MLFGGGGFLGNIILGLCCTEVEGHTAGVTLGFDGTLL